MKSTILYKKSENYTLKADFYGTNRENAPVIIYIHGGGLLWGTREELSEQMVQLYTDNGFALFSIDYRLAPETKLPNILEDVRDALHWVESEGPKQYSINPERIAVIGSSAGGFLALSTGTFTLKPRAIVSFYGYGDIGANWATNPNKYYCQKDLVPKEMAKKLVTNNIITEGTVEDRFLLYLYARQTGEWIQEITGINPQINPEELLAFSPIHNIHEDYPPTLLLHGTNDVDVPYEQSVFMRAALLKKGVQCKLITIPNGEHVFDKDFHNPVVQNSLKQVIEFLQIYLDN
ncbi:alpha/beta hydrolase [Bacillus sp. CGMCC 1.16607]|uniref:alpha/beta hydrolase n=1 Tax=Bacillus sp. CGMCC 1.16607 TaxID=3351842 RepID=UPI00363F6EA8